MAAWITGLATILTIIILLLVILQVGLFLQGVILLAPEKKAAENAVKIE
jgi:flagellar basal body-associated protein FliL